MSKKPLTVVLPKRKLELGEIDGLDYLKKYGEHLLAVKLQKWRNGTGDLSSFFDELEDIIDENEDSLVQQ